MVHIKKFLRVLPTAILLLLGVSSIVHAQGNPDAISIGDVAVFRSVSESGDQLWVMRYDVNYGTEPSEPASDLYLMAIYDTDGTTLLYTRSIRYYQHNITSIYLTPAQALTWEGAYIVRVTANPAIIAPVIEGTNMASRTLGGGDYYEQAFLGGYLLTQAQILEDDWVIALLTSGGLLNTTGGTFFTQAIPGLNNMAPEIFQVTTFYPTVEAVDYNHTYTAELEARRGPDLNQTMIDLSALFLGDGSKTGWMGMAMSGFLAAMVGALVFAATKSPTWSLMFGGAVLPGMVFVGILEFGVFAIILTVVVLLFGILFLMGRLG